MDPWKALHDSKKELWCHWNGRDKLPKGEISLRATHYWCSGCILQVSGTGPDSCDHPGTTWYPPPRLVGAANHVVQTDGTLSKCNLPPLQHGKQYPWDRVIVLSRWNWALSPGAFKHPASKVLPCFLKCNSHGTGGDISVNNLVSYDEPRVKSSVLCILWSHCGSQC